MVRKKHRRVSMRKLQARYRLPQQSGVRATKWCEGDSVLFSMSSIPVEPYRLAWERPPAFVIDRGEPGA